MYDFPKESQLISKSREINNYKSFWYVEKIKNAIQTFKLNYHRKPVVAIMGLDFKPNIDDLRESPAQYVAKKIMQTDLETTLVVEPNIEEHSIFKLTNYNIAYEQADIIAFLVAHNGFKSLEKKNDKIILYFCEILKK